MAKQRNIDGVLRALQPTVDLRGFEHMLLRSSLRMLLLDYDGTLAPFVTQRDQAVPYPGIRELLSRIIADPRNRVVIISGRAVADLKPLLAIDPLPEIWGSHGWERLMRDGSYEAPPFPDAVIEMFDEEWQWLLEHFDAAQLERKPASVALHWRGLEPARQKKLEREARRKWRPLGESEQFEVHAFDGGLELRAAGRNKGDAVRTLLGEVGEDVPIAYFGDDQTDEDAFKALKGRGLRILVRPEVRDTEADIHCVPPEGLHTLLQLWNSSHV
ncbi:trehalose-phosphatase [bacterium]|nr:trehalose-phosphatase [bacterium]